MTAGAAGAIVLAEGHAIDRAAVDRKRRILNGLPIAAVLLRTRVWAKASVPVKLLDVDYFGSVSIFYAYRAAVACKDWPTVDRLVLDALARKPSAYDRLLDAEEWMQAFSGRLCAEAETAHAAYRWIDPPELESYLGGTFESRVEDDLTRRGFKALSMSHDLKFLLRKVMMAVPLDCMRGRIKCVRYTCLPRKLKARNERIEDAKSALNAVEAEVRAPDGTAVPSGTVFTA